MMCGLSQADPVMTSHHYIMECDMTQQNPHMVLPPILTCVVMALQALHFTCAG